jgi:methylglutaconyl-CoA hydratase
MKKNKEQDEQGHVEFHLNSGIATIEFYHPLSNSLPSYMLGELAEIITNTGQNSMVNVIVLKSRGEKAFCGGASFEELTSIVDIVDGERFFSGFAKVLNAMRTCEKLIIGRIQGKAVGGGVGLASAMDYCFATEHASIKLSELAIGIGPFVVGPAVSRKIGEGAAQHLAISPEAWQTAQWAKEKGLYNEVYPDTESMDIAIQAFAQKLNGYNPKAMSNIKKIFWEGTEHWSTLLFERAEISGKLVLSDFTKNAIEQFKSK